MKCEVPGCKKPASWPHHIVNQGTRKSQGCDCPVNKIDLCDEHHTRVHAMGRWGFFQWAKLINRLNAALAHRNERNQGKLECSPSWAKGVAQ